MMPIKNDRRLTAGAPEFPPQPETPYLPDAVVSRVLRYCDEPTRANAAATCQAFRDLVPLARQEDYAEAALRPGRWTREALPTLTELADRGCRTPDYRKVLNGLNRSSAGGIGAPKSLRLWYEKAAHLQQAAVLGTAWKCYVENEAAWYTGGGNGSFGNRPEGFGMMTWFNGRRAEGEFQRGKLHGRGMSTWPEGTRYDGEYQNGELHGQGVYTYQGGERYEGDFQNNQHHGQGVYTWPNGKRYDGDFKNGRPHGRGVYLLPNGARYDGEFLNGKRDGQGVQTCSDGWRYDGAWKDDKVNGRGVETSPGGKRQEGYWKNNVFDGFVAQPALPPHSTRLSTEEHAEQLSVVLARFTPTLNLTE